MTSRSMALTCIGTRAYNIHRCIVYIYINVYLYFPVSRIELNKNKKIKPRERMNDGFIHLLYRMSCKGIPISRHTCCLNKTGFFSVLPIN